MKISVVIGHVPYSDKAERMLDKCISSIKGQYDELILVVNDGIGYGKTFNRGFKYAMGDFIILISNDTELLEGNLKDLLDSEKVTTPSVNGGSKQFGCFCCIPRHIYKEIGLFDECFKGAYWEDEDLLRRWTNAGIEVKMIDKVKISHIGGATVKAIMDEGALAQTNREIFDDKWKT